MYFDIVKDKLHDYIEHADQNKVMAIYTLLNNEIEGTPAYDESTLNILEARMNDMLSGKEKPIPRNRPSVIYKDIVAQNSPSLDGLTSRVNFASSPGLQAGV